MSKICCFTGHRALGTNREAVYKKTEKLLRELIENEAVTDFRTGGAIGFDTVAALCVLSLKKDYPHIKLHLILPCKTQDRYFSSMDKKFYRYILSLADSVTYIQDDYSPKVMAMRNRALIDGSDVCVSYLKHLHGGTYQTVTMARKSNLKLLNVAKY